MNTALRKVTLEDAELLLEWRNDESTRNASHNTNEVSLDEHVNWLGNSIHNNNRKLFIYEKDGLPYGTVRADFDGSLWELSWTVSPNLRGKGVAKEMVTALIGVIGSNVRAEVKRENIASVKVAESVGMKLDYEKDEVLFFKMS